VCACTTGEKRKSPVDDLPVSVVDMEHRKVSIESASLNVYRSTLIGNQQPGVIA